MPEHRQHLDCLAVSPPVEKEIHRPDVITAAAAVGPRLFLTPGALPTTLLGYLQACGLPQAFGPACDSLGVPRA